MVTFIRAYEGGRTVSGRLIGPGEIVVANGSNGTISRGIFKNSQLNGVNCFKIVYSSEGFVTYEGAFSSGSPDGTIISYIWFGDGPAAMISASINGEVLNVTKKIVTYNNGIAGASTETQETINISIQTIVFNGQSYISTFQFL